ncbi:retrovirus-related pol polyprotein from transposon TNT 1-94 [Trifolium medium]|uniref:Retrovirus-related pol polyprotein from transposon TNT 1-94 n=1 Tax=Trifolium medium TaxID=97028 RepID=A0A392RKV5_9FABA|nr:retrovirus-related pol polyprotein from transposon TNT 1-94 [Trifolium medium]
MMLTVDQLQSSLQVHEQRMKGQREEEQVLKVSNTGGRGRGRGAPYGRDGGRGRGRGGKGKFNKKMLNVTNVTN